MLKIDAHQHFWNYDPVQYPWMKAGMEMLHRDFGPSDLEAVQQVIGFDGSVAVQARMTLEETRWLLDLAEKHDRIYGVVGFVEFCSPEVSAQLQEFAGHPKCVGMRHVVHDEPDDKFMLRPDFLAGLRELSKYDLVYDLLLFERHLPVAIEVVKQFPEMRFVVDHIAKPSIKANVRSPWDQYIRELATFDNVSCKLSGMVTEADWSSWRAEQLSPYIDTVLEAFGPERLMIGSDWPVCLAAGSYGRVMSVVTDCVAGLTPGEQAQILGGSCERIYRLPELVED